jgi:AcrR family transcriptional regulator
MKSPRIDIAGIRREQIVDAATAIITEQGIQNLSLSEIEKKAGMSRGQLTYYFPAKEDILLAVFDRLVALMHERIGEPDCAAEAKAGAWPWIEHLLEKLITGSPSHPEFGCLQYTFLSQIAHREDFREKLAGLYRFWRQEMAAGVAQEFPTRPSGVSVPSLAFASLVQALLHGLAMQRAADPEAFEGRQMLALCLDVLGTYLGRGTDPAAESKKHPRPAPDHGPDPMNPAAIKSRPVGGSPL